MLHLLEKSRGRRCRAQGNTKTLNEEIHVYSETQPISAQSIWQAGMVFLPRSEVFLPRSKVFLPRSKVFLPRSEVFLPISSWISDYLDKTVQLSGTIRNVRYAVLLDLVNVLVVHQEIQ